jgi:hypothetical protein
MMADDDQPERILQTAIAFYKVQQILNKKTPDDHDQGVALTLTRCRVSAAGALGHSLVDDVLQLPGQGAHGGLRQ